MKARLQLTLGCAGPDTAEKLAAVLGPDNRGAPGDQRFKMQLAGRTVSFDIDSERLGSAFSSLDSVLCDAALFQEVWLLSRARKA
jgi:hypothetical protein